MDTTLGVFLNLIFLRFSERALDYKSGVYAKDSASCSVSAATGPAVHSSRTAASSVEGGGRSSVDLAVSLLSPARGPPPEECSRTTSVEESGGLSPGGRRQVDNGRSRRGPRPTSYRWQVAVWLGIVSCMKVCMAIIFLTCKPVLARLTGFLLDAPLADALAYLCGAGGSSQHNHGGGGAGSPSGASQSSNPVTDEPQMSGSRCRSAPNPGLPSSSRFCSLLQDAGYVKLVVVMVATPAVMNTVQLWITDTFIKGPSTPHRR